MFMGLTEKYGFTPEEICRLTRNQLIVYSGALERKKDLERFLITKRAEGIIHRSDK